MKTHRLANKIPEYYLWKSMKARCYNKNNQDYYNYGGRGIRVCNEWRTDFMAFFSYLGPRPSNNHSIDRIDSNGHYEPGNVRWLPKDKQSANRRCVKKFEIKDETWTLRRLSEAFNLEMKSLRYQIVTRGLPAEAALQKLLQRKNRSGKYRHIN